MYCKVNFDTQLGRKKHLYSIIQRNKVFFSRFFLLIPSHQIYFITKDDVHFDKKSVTI
jgi:hypothetical protein